MRALTLGRARHWAPWVAVLALGVALHGHRSALGRAAGEVERLAPLAERASGRDRLIGADLSRIRLPDPEGRERTLATGAARHLVWFVDPRRCTRCLAELGDWSRVVRSRALEATAVLVGVSAATARRTVRSAGLRGRVLLDPAGELSRGLGVTERMPSLYAVLDSTGTVILSEMRAASLTCDWSFPRQVAVLFGGAASTALNR